jgi:hypothetical protein
MEIHIFPKVMQDMDKAYKEKHTPTIDIDELPM